ncbi:MAG: hypothetical protein ABI388_01980 [Bacteroidia bacterium]
MESGIYLTIKDLMTLTGLYSYSGAGKAHRTIREAIAHNKRKITVREYCEYEGVSYDEVWTFLRSKPDKKSTNK